MVPWSIGTAATIRTGFALVRKSVEAVRVASRSSWLLACMAACFTALVTILWRHQIAAVYNNDPVVLGLASHLLLFAATYQITDAVQVVSVGIPVSYTHLAKSSGNRFRSGPRVRSSGNRPPPSAG